MMQVFCGIVLCVAVAAAALAEEGQAAADSLKGGEMVKIERENHGFYIDKYEVTNEEYAAFLTEKGNAKVEGMYWPWRCIPSRWSCAGTGSGCRRPWASTARLSSPNA